MNYQQYANHQGIKPQAEQELMKVPEDLLSKEAKNYDARAKYIPRFVKQSELLQISCDDLF